MAFSSADNRRLVQKVHGPHARILRELGFNVNFTPTLDLALTNADNGLGTRCFSDDPAVIVKYAREMIAAHEKAGVLISGKHFPGLGDTDRDSHFDLPTVPRAWKKILHEDLYPYKKLLKHLPFIMVNHALYPEVNETLPASLSHEMITEFLLKKWKYTGLSISDDLIMGAVSNMFNLTESAERSLLAGNHLFLVCRPDGVVNSFKRLLARAQSNETFRNQVFKNSATILAFKFKMLKETQSVNLNREIRIMGKYSKQVAKQSIALLHGRPVARIPSKCTVYLPRTKWIKSDPSAIGTYLRSLKCFVQEYFFSIDVAESEAQDLAGRSTTEFNIVVTVNNTRHQGQRALLSALLSSGKKVAMISGGFPREWIPKDAEVAVAAYWTSDVALMEAGRVIMGKQKAKGKLPLGKSRKPKRKKS
jgi:beta-glucosidase-like glycosyl hydrolase